MIRKRYQKLIANFKQPTVMVLGDLMLDEWIWGKVARISPEAPVPVVQVVQRTFTPGGASNVAANVQSLGAKTVVAGMVGADPAGKILKRELRKLGAELSAVLSLKNRPTTLKTRIVAHNQQVVRADVEVRESLDGRQGARLEMICKGMLPKADALLFSDYNKGFMTSSFIRSFIKEGIQKKKIIVAGAKPQNLSLFQNATLVILNESELEQAAGSEIQSERDLENLGSNIRKQLNADALLVTRGERGMALFETEKKVSLIEARASEVYDVSGAGDTVAAVAVVALASGASMLEAAVLANHGAGVVVRKIGTATLSPEELQDSLTNADEK